MIGLKRAPFLALALQAGASQACYAPPPALTIGVDEQIALASDVSVARVQSMTLTGNRRAEYHFTVERRLAGAVLPFFTLAGAAPASHDKDTSFDSHTDPAFWKYGGGRVMNDSDCAMHPSFVVGQAYLIFTGSPPTWRGYEKIDTHNARLNLGDAWLSYVERALAPFGVRN